MEDGLTGKPVSAQCHVVEVFVPTHVPVLTRDQPMVDVLVVDHLITQTTVTKDVVLVNSILLEAHMYR